MAPTECCAKRSVEHLPRIKHQILSSNQPCRSEYADISLSRTLYPIETQFLADWTEPGPGTRAYMDCSTSHSEGGAGDDEMVPCSPLGGRTGGKEKLQQLLGTNIIAGVVNNSAWRFKGTSIRNT